MPNEVAVIRDYDIRDKKLVDATAQSTINSTDAIEMKTTDGNQVFIDKASFIKAVGQAFTASDPKTFTKLLGMNGDGPMGIGASDLASVLGVSDLWDWVLGNYTPIEYLENSSVYQLIDTNYIPQGNGVEIGGSFYYMGYYTSDQYMGLVYVAYTSENANTFRIIRNVNSDSIIILNHNTRGGGGGTEVPISLNTKNDFVLNDNAYTFNGVQYARGRQGAENTASLKIFNGGHIRLYSFYIKKDGTLVRDFIPVRVGNVGYLYDKVSGELFGNSGIGSFVLGPDL